MPRNVHRDLNRLRMTCTSLSHAIERKSILIDVLNLRGHHDRVAIEEATLQVYYRRLRTIETEANLLAKAACVQYRRKLEAQIVMRPTDSLDQESTRADRANLSIGEILGLMYEKEDAYRQPRPDGSEPEAA